MKIVCPFTSLNEATEMVLKAEHRNEVEFVDVGDSPESYFWLMRRCWGEGETFIVVEHDIVPWPGALQLISDCEESLCGYQAPLGIFNGKYSGMGLGLVKYGERLMIDFPGHFDDPTLLRLWNRVDGEVTNRLVYDLGIPIHYHFPAVIHLNRQRFPI